MDTLTQTILTSSEVRDISLNTFPCSVYSHPSQPPPSQVSNSCRANRSRFAVTMNRRKCRRKTSKANSNRTKSIAKQPCKNLNPTRDLLCPRSLSNLPKNAQLANSSCSSSSRLLDSADNLSLEDLSLNSTTNKPMRMDSGHGCPSPPNLTSRRSC